MTDPVVLVISETPGFSQAILEHWQQEPRLPSPIAMSADLCGNLLAESFDLAILEGLSPVRLETLLRQLQPQGKTVLVLVPDQPTADRVADSAHNTLVLCNASRETLALVAQEILKRQEAIGRLATAEDALAVTENDARLGRYITEMRHTINNALTSVMGNSELLLFDSNALAPNHRGQIETIRTMSLRIHEIMQRLASLETEMKWMEKQREHDLQRKMAAVN